MGNNICGSAPQKIWWKSIDAKSGTGFEWEKVDPNVQKQLSNNAPDSGEPIMAGYETTPTILKVGEIDFAQMTHKSSQNGRAKVRRIATTSKGEVPKSTAFIWPEDGVSWWYATSDGWKPYVHFQPEFRGCEIRKDSHAHISRFENRNGKKVNVPMIIHFNQDFTGGTERPSAGNGYVRPIVKTVNFRVPKDKIDSITEFTLPINKEVGDEFIKKLHADKTTVICDIPPEFIEEVQDGRVKKHTINNETGYRTKRAPSMLEAKINQIFLEEYKKIAKPAIQDEFAPIYFTHGGGDMQKFPISLWTECLHKNTKDNKLFWPVTSSLTHKSKNWRAGQHKFLEDFPVEFICDLYVLRIDPSFYKNAGVLYREFYDNAASPTGWKKSNMDWTIGVRVGYERLKFAPDFPDAYLFKEQCAANADMKIALHFRVRNPYHPKSIKKAPMDRLFLDVLQASEI